jgi:FAD:protein FMN transferase
MPEVSSFDTSYRFDAIGTAWSIDSADALDGDTLQRIHLRIEVFDRFWSRFRDDSIVHTMSTTPGSYPLPAEARALFDFYAELYEASHGRVTPLVGSALEHWGYDRTYSLSPRPGLPQALPSWSAALSVVDNTLVIPRPIVLDIGAAGKGLLVDLVSDILIEDGHIEFVVDASGDLRRHTMGDTVERVGLENPHNPALAIGVAEIGNHALAGSGTQRRRWGEGLHHVLDGVTGLPTTGVSASWVIAPSAMVADGLATALLIVEPETIESRWAHPWAIMLDNGQVRYSENFPGEFFS